MRRWRTVLLVLPLLTGACGGGDDEGPAESTIKVAGQTANDHGARDVSATAGTEMELGDFYFSPTVLTGTPGQTLTIAATNRGDVNHTFTVPEQGINLTVEPGSQVSGAVTFPDSGVVAFVCTFHAQDGMVGGLASGGVAGPPVEEDEHEEGSLDTDG